jgi:hypothetical protein
MAYKIEAGIKDGQLTIDGDKLGELKRNTERLSRLQKDPNIRMTQELLRWCYFVHNNKNVCPECGSMEYKIREHSELGAHGYCFNCHGNIIVSTNGKLFDAATGKCGHREMRSRICTKNKIPRHADFPPERKYRRYE